MPSIHDLTAELVSSLEPREIVLRLVEQALDIVPAERCTLTSLDQEVIRVEASYERGKGRPAWLGKEYDISYLARQPLLAAAVREAKIATGGGFDNDDTDPDLRPDLAGVRHTAVVPLALGDEVGAVLILSRRGDDPFNPEELTRLQEIGVLAVLALRNARLYQAVNEAQARGLETLTLISQNLAASDELPAFFGKMSASVARLVDAEKAAFWMLEGGHLVAQAEAFGFEPAVLGLMRVPLDGVERSALSRVLSGGQAVGGRIQPRSLEGQYGEVLRAMDIRDVVAVPWRTADRQLGILVACDSRSGFLPQDEWVMRVAARASAVVWQGYEAERRLVAMQARERENLEQHAARMAELEQLKSQFLRLASHELRTPLTIVRGYLSMFQEGVFGELPDKALEVLPTITARVAQMNLMIDQMLNAARLEDSRLVTSPRNIRVDQLIDKVVESFQGLLRPGQAILVDNPLGAATAYADPEKVETIVGNLVSNAIKYSPGGGDIRCALAASETELVISVVDQGIGIAAADQGKLFQRFGRIDRPETVNIGGTGLGLFLSRELARLQGGDVRFEAAVTGGSIFRLILPLAAPAK